MVNEKEGLSDDHDAEKVFSVVAIGVSAGGLESLEKLFSNLPSKTGLAFVVIQHLSPDFKSMLSELLGRRTQIAIETAVDGVRVEPDTIYLMPSGKEMIISDGKLLLTDRDSHEVLSLPIDHFYRSMAHDLGPRGIAVVMSGTGSDGSRGVLAIHDAAGLVFCQSSETAQFDGMPNSAVRSNVVDLVGSPEVIASALVQVAQHTDEFGDRDRYLPIVRSEEMADRHHADLFALLRERHGIDFFEYKPTIIERRIVSRARQLYDGNVDRYLTALQSNPEQLDQLYRDLLIGVTEFFRDEKSFLDLTESIETALAGIPDGGTFRAWVSACATGEEAYSMAILIDEAARRLNRRIEIKVFGTDVHKESIETAHEGIYSADTVAKLSQDRIERYFGSYQDSYQVSTDLRNMLIFAVHDLVKNPPFTQMHLVSCRNLLIYLKPHTQKKVLSLLHFGLRSHGILFLGSSESLGELEHEFDCLSASARVYVKRRDVRLVSSFRSDRFGLVSSPNRVANELLERSDHELSVELEAVLNATLAPTLLVDPSLNLKRLFAGAGKYLQPSNGAPSTCLSDLVSGDLRAGVVAGVKRVKESHSPAVVRNVTTDCDHQRVLVNLRIVPVQRDHDEQFAISFERLPGDQETTPSQQMSHSNSLTSIPVDRVAELENELSDTRRDLRAAIDESRANSERLQTTNEELMATNEELQGANEELQSVNEELFTVNAEHQGKIVELTELTNDMEHLLRSTEVHTLFLDRDLRIRKFTPKMTEVFELVPDDCRRPIQNFAHNIVCDDLIGRLQKVVADDCTVEEEVQDISGSHYLMRILPYRDNGDINGVVLTLTDVTELILTQKNALDAARRFERAVEASSDGIWDWPDTSNTNMWWSDACYRLLGYEPGEFPSTFEAWTRLIHPVDLKLVKESTLPESGRCNMELHRDLDYRIRHKSGEYRWFRHRTLVDIDFNGRAIRMTGSVCDIHQRKRAELQASLEIQRRDRFLAMLSHELRNPLAAAKNAVDVLKDDGSPHLSDLREQIDSNTNQWTADGDNHSENELAILDVIDRQVSHMSRLLDDLLEVARIQQNKIELKMQCVDLHQLSRQALESVQHQVSSKRQCLKVSLPEWPASVLVDPDRLTQAQVNLLVNASKYSGVETEIHYEIILEDNQAVINIRDQGQGICEEELESIFDLFFQADQSLDHTAGGMGVGLSLAKGIIDAHGGTITALSDGLGEGTTMSIRLPLASESAKPHEATPTKSIGRIDEITDLPTIVIVEDNVDILRLTSRLLKQCGYPVLTACDGYEALELINQFHPTVALVDIGLPGINGHQLARRLRKTEVGRSMTMIAVTGYGDKANRQEAKAAGFDHHLVKPVDLDQLNRLILNSHVANEPVTRRHEDDGEFQHVLVDQSSSSSP